MTKHEKHKELELNREPKRFKKELTIDHDLYQHELQLALKKGVNTGYTQALNTIVNFIKSDSTFIEFFRLQDVHPLWEYVMTALNREDEWKEYQIELEKEGDTNE